MTDVREKYFGLALAWSIKSDFEYVRWLVDTRAFPDNAINNRMARALYVAASRSYARVAPRGVVPTLGDVVVELASLASNDVARAWESKIATMEKPELSQAKSIAIGMSTEYDKNLILGNVETWVSKVRDGTARGTIYSQFTRLSDDITKALVGEQRTGRPKDILEQSWSSRLRRAETTGYPRIDKALDGGWTAGRFYILGMPSSHGKSSLACNFGSRRAELALPTLINSFEMAADDMLFRMICDIAEVSIDVAENPHGRAAGTELERIMQAKDLLDQYVRIYDTPADAAEIKRRIRRHKVEFKDTVILTVLDHLGILRRGGKGSEWSEIESMAYSLSDIAKEENVPFLANSQVPDAMERELIHSNLVYYNMDFRGSRGIRNAVDYAIVGCKHSGLAKVEGGDDYEYDYNYLNHTVMQTIKNRRTGKLFWGVFEYDPIHYKLKNTKNPDTKDDVYG